MIKKTKNYDMFQLRNDNRDGGASESRWRLLAKSIEHRNLLEFRPIVVNKNMEIFDGQHRFMAAKHLGVDIYYEVNDDLAPEDIIIMNNAKAWGSGDYLNFYVKNGYVEYQRLQEFMKEHQLSLKVALCMCHGHAQSAAIKFKQGKFEFPEDLVNQTFDVCWQTVDYIKKLNGHSPYVSSGRFWQAMLRLIQHVDFREDKWMKNLMTKIDHMNVRATTKEYYKLFMDIYNWKNHTKINLFDDYNDVKEYMNEQIV